MEVQPRVFDVPFEVLEKIFAYLSRRDLYALRSTCRYIGSAATDVLGATHEVVVKEDDVWQTVLKNNTLFPRCLRVRFAPRSVPKTPVAYYAEQAEKTVIPYMHPAARITGEHEVAESVEERLLKKH